MMNQFNCFLNFLNGTMSFRKWVKVTSKSYNVSRFVARDFLRKMLFNHYNIDFNEYQFNLAVSRILKKGRLD